jgi:hypothetical protein
MHAMLSIIIKYSSDKDLIGDDNMKTKWMELVAKVRKENPKLSLKDAMKLAKKSYKKD